MPGAASPTSPGVILRQRRTSAHLTQRELATKADVSVSVIRNLEQGATTQPQFRSVQRISAVLPLPPGWPVAMSASSRHGNQEGSHLRPRAAIAQLSPSGSGLRIEILGPLFVWRHGQRVPLGPPGQQVVLAVLAAEPGTVVQRADLADAVWGEDEPPATATMVIHTYLSRLRSALDPLRAGLIQRAGTGYQLAVRHAEVDLLAFRSLACQARQAASSGHLRTACDHYQQALALWRGEPLAGLASLSSHPAVTTLAHEYAATILQYGRTAADLGDHDSVLPHLHTLTARQPLNERACAHLMTALAGAGQRGAALAAYQQMRQRLRDELGIHPGPDLTAAHTSILADAVAPPRLPVGTRFEPPRRSSRPAVLLGTCPAEGKQFPA